jgi:hypothetical protein
MVVSAHGPHFSGRCQSRNTRRIAGGLLQHPEWIESARANLDRWIQRTSNAPSLLRCYAEWHELLMKPLSEICAVLTAETGEGQRMNLLPGCCLLRKSGKSSRESAMQRPHLEHKSFENA